MSEKELEKEAEEYASEWGDKTDGTYACCRDGYLAGAEPREKQIDQLQKINNKQKETLKKLRIALIQERTANIINYGKGGVEMFDSMFEILNDVSD